VKYEEMVLKIEKKKMNGTVKGFSWARKSPSEENLVETWFVYLFASFLVFLPLVQTHSIRE